MAAQMQVSELCDCSMDGADMRIFVCLSCRVRRTRSRTRGGAVSSSVRRIRRGVDQLDIATWSRAHVILLIRIIRILSQCQPVVREEDAKVEQSIPDKFIIYLDGRAGDIILSAPHLFLE